MRTTLSNTIRLFGLLALITLSIAASGPGWAGQREATLLRGPMSPMTERPTAVNCTLGQVTTCQGAGVPSCNAICNNPKQGAGDCNNCMSDATARCMAQVCK
jgi:hypothetical protein